MSTSPRNTVALWAMLVTALASSGGCDSGGDGRPQVCPGVGDCYAYQAFSMDGEPVAVGVMAFEEIGGAVRGRYVIERRGSGDAGDQIGTGAVSGEIDGETFVAALLSDQTGGTVELVGAVSPGRISGQWSSRASAGGVATGVFELAATEGGP